MSDHDTDDESRRSRRRAANQRYKARNKDRINAERRERYATDPEYKAKVMAADAKSKRERSLKQTYGISLQDYDRMLAQHAGACGICRKKSDRRRLCVDHCHEAKKLRGPLCLKCNLGLGVFHDSPALLRLAAGYIEHWRRLHAEGPPDTTLTT
jgi:hypothetical protein